MGKGIHRLPATWQRLGLGLHCDGGNLYLQVSKGPNGNNRRSWVFQYRLRGTGRSRDMGLGGSDYVGLAEARELAVKYKNMTRRGIDPIEARNREVAANLAASMPVPTFDECVAAYLKEVGDKWSNAEHRRQWAATLEQYVSPIVGRLMPRDITLTHVRKVLDPIWRTKTVTASRVQQRAAMVWDWAKVHGHATGDNPFRWDGWLDKIYPSPKQITTVRRVPALDFKELPEFMGALLRRTDVESQALAFLTLTAVRASDVLDARWSDIDLNERKWTIVEFSKRGQKFVVPLSDAAIAILKSVEPRGDLVFISQTGKRMHSERLRLVVVDMGYGGRMSPHGARSCFKTWSSDATTFPSDLIEFAMGHTVGNAVEQAYQRGSAFPKRAAVMDAWARFCTGEKAGKVVKLLGGRRG